MLRAAVTAVRGVCFEPLHLLSGCNMCLCSACANETYICEGLKIGYTAIPTYLPS